MNIKADFYIGIGKDSQWIGSLLNHGSVYKIPSNILLQINKTMFEEMILELLELSDSIIPDKGDKWNYLYSDSSLTDYVYMFDHHREKVLMYQSETDVLYDPIKIIQGQGLIESIEIYEKPEFPKIGLYYNKERRIDG